jgi:hypothetical protein
MIEEPVGSPALFLSMRHYVKNFLKSNEEKAQVKTLPPDQRRGTSWVQDAIQLMKRSGKDF